MYVYLNGCFIKKEEAAIPIDDRGLLLGDGLFETMRSYSGRVLLIEQHYKRLIDSLAKLEFSHDMDFNHFKHIIQSLIEKNQLEKHDATIRFTLTRGSGPRGLLPPAEPMCLSMGAIFPLTVQATPPIKAIISTIRRNEYSPATYIKSTSYIDNILAKQEAVHKGAQEAILLNTQGYIAEATIANIFLIKDKQIYTPKISDGILPGITRQNVIALCKKIGVEIIEISVPQHMAFEADEIFLTNCVMEIQPISTVDSIVIGNGLEGELTVILQGEYRKFIEESSEYPRVQASLPTMKSSIKWDNG